jgi:hypothetical protein
MKGDQQEFELRNPVSMIGLCSPERNYHPSAG